MARFLKRRDKKKGLPPGSLVYMAESKNENVKISVLNFNATHFKEQGLQNIEQCVADAKDINKVTWIDIEGLSDTKTIESIGKIFGVHRLWLEDVLNTDHRPKVDELNDLVFMILKLPSDYDKRQQIFFDQFSLFLGQRFVLSFHEYPTDIFEPVKNRLRNDKGRIRGAGPDYLFYSLIDSIVDGYYQTLEHVGKKIEETEELIAKVRSKDMPEQIIRLKNELLYLGKAALPIRDALAHICRSTSRDIDEETKEYFKDAYEHAVQIVDVIESYRQMLISMTDFFHILVSLRANEIMAVLTMFSTVFIPLTFIVGLYGMNFDSMPEYHWKLGYPFVLAILLTVALSVIIYFKRRKWL